MLPRRAALEISALQCGQRRLNDSCDCDGKHAENRQAHPTAKLCVVQQFNNLFLVNWFSVTKAKAALLAYGIHFWALREHFGGSLGTLGGQFRDITGTFFGSCQFLAVFVSPFLGAHIGVGWTRK
jgi:hypothetical protein